MSDYPDSTCPRCDYDGGLHAPGCAGRYSIDQHPLHQAMFLIGSHITSTVWDCAREFYWELRDGGYDMPPQQASDEAHQQEIHAHAALAVAMFRSGLVWSSSHLYPMEAPADWERQEFWSWTCDLCGNDAISANGASNGCAACGYSDERFAFPA